jgi:monoamine oxidase
LGQGALFPISYDEVDSAREYLDWWHIFRFYAPGVWTSFGEALFTPVGPIHSAGTENGKSLAEFSKEQSAPVRRRPARIALLLREK